MCAWVRSNYDSWTHLPGMRDCGQQLKSRSAASNSSQEVRPATQEMRSTTQEVRPDLQLKNSKCSRQFKKLIKRAMGATSVIAMLVKKPSGRNQLASD